MNKRTLVVGDLHLPVEKKGYFEFCKDIYKLWKCDSVVFMGDIIDWHGISFHLKSPNSPGVVDEYELALDCVKKWYKAFPKAKVCIGNHDARIERLAETVGIPSRFLLSYKKLWETPGWDWEYEHILNGVYYFHGIGYGGLHPAFNAARQMGMSVCMGHVHSTGGIKWMVNPLQRWFGMDVGCGVDDKRYAFAYGMHLKKKSVISCGVVINGNPYHEMMPLEKY